MHYHLEVVMPPTDDVAAALRQILGEPDWYDPESPHQFFDYYLIGGDWSGVKSKYRLQSGAVDSAMDVCTVAMVPEDLTAARVLIVERNSDGTYVDRVMLVREFDGVRPVGEAKEFDGYVLPAIQEFGKASPDWLCVTVDYHI